MAYGPYGWCKVGLLSKAVFLVPWVADPGVRCYPKYPSPDRARLRHVQATSAGCGTPRYDLAFQISVTCRGGGEVGQLSGNGLGLGFRS